MFLVRYLPCTCKVHFYSAFFGNTHLSCNGRLYVYCIPCMFCCSVVHVMRTQLTQPFPRGTGHVSLQHYHIIGRSRQEINKDVGGLNSARCHGKHVKSMYISAVWSRSQGVYLPELRKIGC